METLEKKLELTIQYDETILQFVSDLRDEFAIALDELNDKLFLLEDLLFDVEDGFQESMRNKI